MAKASKHIYVNTADVTDMFRKGMEDRGVMIESIVYPSVQKGTKIHGYENYCAIEQNGKVLGRKEDRKSVV